MRVPPVVRFVLACCLFAAWIGWLTWQAAHSKRVVLSHPQLLVSEIDVLAEVPALDKPVVVKEVLFANIKDSAIVPGATIRVENLAECKRLRREDEKAEDVSLDWKESGLYLLPLRTTANGQSYAVVETPSSPGYPPPRTALKGSPRLYPASDDVLRQYRDFRSAK